MGTEPEGAGPSAPCSPVSAAWRALRNTCSRCSFTQPRVLRRLERKPTAAGYLREHVCSPSRPCASGSCRGPGRSPTGRGAQLAFSSLRRPLGPARTRPETRFSGHGERRGSGRPGGGPGRPPCPALAPAPLRPGGHRPLTSVLVTRAALFRPRRGGGAGGGGHWPAARRGGACISPAHARARPRRPRLPPPPPPPP